MPTFEVVANKSGLLTISYEIYRDGELVTIVTLLEMANALKESRLSIQEISALDILRTMSMIELDKSQYAVERIHNDRQV